MRPKHIAALVLTASVTLVLCLEGQSPQERLKKKVVQRRTALRTGIEPIFGPLNDFFRRTANSLGIRQRVR